MAKTYLLSEGAYRFSRNPMYLSELTPRIQDQGCAMVWKAVRMKNRRLETISAITRR